MQSSDFRLVLGNLPCDTNNGGFSRPAHPSVDVYIDPHTVRIPGQAPITVPIRSLLQSLAHYLDISRQPRPGRIELPEKYVDDDRDGSRISHSWLWDHFSRSFLLPNDVLFGGSGTAAYGIPDATFPANVRWIAQSFYSSIGFATPAAFGADMALRELATASGSPRGRTILVTGDGSLMLTIQEIGNMIKHKTAPVIFIINNAG
jgi:pyruvate decarboxylase